MHSSIFVGCTGFEPATPALSRRCSEPTELTTQECELNALSIFKQGKMSLFLIGPDQYKTQKCNQSIDDQYEESKPTSTQHIYNITQYW